MDNPKRRVLYEFGINFKHHLYLFLCDLPCANRLAQGVSPKGHDGRREYRYEAEKSRIRRGLSSQKVRPEAYVRTALTVIGRCRNGEGRSGNVLRRTLSSQCESRGNQKHA